MTANPYYRDEAAGITLWHGDSREIVPTLGAHDAIITDPVWPNASVPLAGADDPAGLLAAVLRVATADRVLVHLGCDTDPRFLAAVPMRWPFLRVCWLRFSRPNYKGRLLNGAEVAYLFGTPSPVRDGAFVMPGESATEGEICNTASDPRLTWHPCPRRLSFVTWLVKWFGGGLVLDPFAGSGTTLVAAKELGVRTNGVEIDERYCEGIAKRLDATTPTMFPVHDRGAERTTA